MAHHILDLRDGFLPVEDKSVEKKKKKKRGIDVSQVVQLWYAKPKQSARSHGKMHEKPEVDTLNCVEKREFAVECM